MIFIHEDKRNLVETAEWPQQTDLVTQSDFNLGADKHLNTVLRIKKASFFKQIDVKPDKQRPAGVKTNISLRMTL